MTGMEEKVGWAYCRCDGSDTVSDIRTFPCRQPLGYTRLDLCIELVWNMSYNISTAPAHTIATSVTTTHSILKARVSSETP